MAFFVLELEILYLHSRHFSCFFRKRLLLFIHLFIIILFFLLKHVIFFLIIIILKHTWSTIIANFILN